jgi:prephenate dehydrogenase
MERLPSLFSRIALVGAGLIGGSWGLALKRRGFAGRVVACDRPEVLKRALAAGAADEGEPDPAAAVRGADLVILAAPVGAILEQLGAVRAAAAPRALVTDTGSTKRAIMNRARELFAGGALFLGGHPLAGKEQSGIGNADPDLFEGTRYVVTPLTPGGLDDPLVLAFQGLVRAVGAEPRVIEAEEHDRALALLSHLPQLLSTALAALAGEGGAELPLELAAGGFRDMTRLADSPYAIWRDVGVTNADNLRVAVDAFTEKLEAMKQHLEDEQLEVAFNEAQRLRERWRNLR